MLHRVDGETACGCRGVAMHRHDLVAFSVVLNLLQRPVDKGVTGALGGGQDHGGLVADEMVDRTEGVACIVQIQIHEVVDAVVVDVEGEGAVLVDGEVGVIVQSREARALNVVTLADAGVGNARLGDGLGQRVLVVIEVLLVDLDTVGNHMREEVHVDLDVLGLVLERDAVSGDVGLDDLAVFVLDVDVLLLGRRDCHVL